MKKRRKQYNRGQAVLIAAIFFIGITLSVVLGISGPALRAQVLVRSEFDSKKSYLLAESLVEDMAYRLKKGIPVDDTESLVVDGHTVSASTITEGNNKTISASADIDRSIRTVDIHLVSGSGASFSYGVQTHVGGFVMENSSLIRGNLFSNGTISGSGGNMVYGDIISAGPSGSINKVHATGTVWSNAINDATIDGDAYYQTISNTIVVGSEFPGSGDQTPAELPITDTQVEEWKADALAGGVIDSPCPYVINSDVTLGPIKINCDLEIKNNPNVIIAGAVWVNGTITLSNTPTIQVDAGLTNKSVPIIADNPTDRITSSSITINNANEFIGNGVNSYILLLSQNESAEQGGGEFAIEVGNSANGDLLLYAGHGEVRINNNASLKEVSAWRVRLKNSAEVIYETGLANTLFTSGPSGGYEIDSWTEVE